MNALEILFKLAWIRCLAEKPCNRAERLQFLFKKRKPQSGEYLKPKGRIRRCKMYAIIATGGRQYKVQEGDVITVEKLAVEPGTAYKFEEVLAIGEGEGLSVGTPFVDGAEVVATVIGNGKEKKVIIYKYKAKKGFHKKKGHRQPFTKLKIETVKAASGE
jgi:large subunit ribosomal protein L21